MIRELNQRSRQIFRSVVETYLETGVPVGSKTLSARLPMALSPASIRNVMASLEDAGLLFAPHISAGRLPTQAGLRIFVDGLLEVGNLTEGEQTDINSHCVAAGRNTEEVLTEAVTALSGLCHCAGLVVAPKLESPVRHVEFVDLGSGQALVIIVTEDGAVENRVINIPLGITPSALRQASNYLNARLSGRTLDETRGSVETELEQKQAELDALSARVVQAGLASWSGDNDLKNLIVRGRANLLDDIEAIEDLERIRILFEDLETKRDMVRLLNLAEQGEGVRIFIGSENNLFSLSGSSVIVAPYKNGRGKVVGALGVIGPTRVNYARVVPMVDYTAKVIGKIFD
jgi:heat-inducible transcriptional repressor